MTKRYVIIDVFDFVFLKDGEEVFRIDTVQSNTISHEEDDNFNTLKITDATMKIELLNDIYNGVYDNVNLSIYGQSIVRDVENGVDYEITMTIEESKIFRHSFSNKHTVELLFTFPIKNVKGKDNLSLRRVEKK